MKTKHLLPIMVFVLAISIKAKTQSFIVINSNEAMNVTGQMNIEVEYHIGDTLYYDGNPVIKLPYLWNVMQPINVTSTMITFRFDFLSHLT